MGRLANSQLRHKRILAHRALEQYRKQMHMNKYEAYLWLRTKLQLSEKDGHIACFSKTLCDKVISLCHTAAQKNRKRKAG